MTIAGGSERFDAVVSTLPMPLLARVARGALADAVPLSDLRYQGVVNALVVSRARLERFYWTSVVDPALPVPGRRRDDARHPARVDRRAPSHLPDELLRRRRASRTSAPTTSWRDRRSRASRRSTRASAARTSRRSTCSARRTSSRPGRSATSTGVPSPRVGAQPRSICARPPRRIRASLPGIRASALARETTTAVLADLGRSAAAAG